MAWIICTRSSIWARGLSRLVVRSRSVKLAPSQDARGIAGCKRCADRWQISGGTIGAELGKFHGSAGRGNGWLRRHRIE